MSYEKLLKQKRIYPGTFEYIKHKYDTRKDKENLYGVGLSDTEFASILITELLGEDWYIVDPLSHTQCNEVALLEILERYSPKKK